MTWVGLLLADPSPNLRLRVLRELMHRSAGDPEVQELSNLRTEDTLVVDLLAQQQADGSWSGDALLGSVGTAGDTSATTRVRATSFALQRLGFLGWRTEQTVVRRGADFLFAHQQPDGSWPLPRVRPDHQAGAPVQEDYSMIPLQTAIPLRGLALCGYATDPRAEQAYEWLLAQRLPDGAWPTGVAAGVHGRVAGYRRLAHSRWGCRSNTTGALTCLALHPQRRSSEAAQRGLDLLLGRETREAHVLGFETARLAGFEPIQGFFTYYARFDAGLLLELCAAVGATPEDARVAALAEFVRGQQGSYGLWTYANRPQAARWVSFVLLNALASLDAGQTSDWLSLEPRTPFQPYPQLHPRV